MAFVCEKRSSCFICGSYSIYSSICNTLEVNHAALEIHTAIRQQRYYYARPSVLIYIVLITYPVSGRRTVSWPMFETSAMVSNQEHIKIGIAMVG